MYVKTYQGGEIQHSCGYCFDVTIHSRPVGMTSQAGISPLPDGV